MKIKRNRLLIILFIIILFVVTATFTLGKYAYNNAWNYYLSSKGFYFESDLLSINTKKNSLLRWDGSDISFEIRNSQNAAANIKEGFIHFVVFVVKNAEVCDFASKVFTLFFAILFKYSEKYNYATIYCANDFFVNLYVCGIWSLN